MTRLFFLINFKPVKQNFNFDATSYFHYVYNIKDIIYKYTIINIPNNIIFKNIMIEKFEMN